MRRDTKVGSEPRNKASHLATNPRGKRGRNRVLTHRIIERISEPKVADAVAPGLIVRRRETATHVVRDFCFRWYDSDGRDRLKTLGEFPSLSLEQARSEARRLRLIVQRGGDPQLQLARERDARQQADREQKALGTFGDLLSFYVAALRDSGKISADEVENAFERHVRKPHPQLCSRAARDITALDIRDIVRKVIRTKRPDGSGTITRRSNMIRAHLHAAFARAAKADLDPSLPAGVERSEFGLTANPVTSVPRKAAFDRALSRTLDDGELKEYVVALEVREDAIGLALHVALLLGGQRLAQLLRVTWDDYDNKVGTLRLCDTKGRGGAREHLLPISKGVADRLPLRQPDCPFIFSTGGGKPIHASTLSVEVSAIAGPLAKKQGVAAFTARDVRRTVETRLAALGVSRDTRAQVLSHGLKRGVQERHYDMHTYLPEKAEALAIWEKHLQSLKEPTPPPPKQKGKPTLRLVA